MTAKPTTFFIAAVTALLLFAQTIQPVLANEAATDLIKRTATKMLSTLEMQRADVDRDPRLIYQLVSEILLPHFDFAAITQSAVGSSWRTATPQQRTALIDGFQQMLVRTYARALLNYTGQDIIYQSAKPGTRPNTVIVPTLVRAPGAAAVPIDYRLKQQGSEWKVYDVVIENVSLIANYRGQFRSIISSGGIDGLIQELTTKNASKL
ncbi:ABC transporter substrate-binding protein [Rhodoferax sp. 4810]|uniref:ABC transporter substrate-binding protein n=1 Tax=Thiospirillum jenense TaxID=1653858 RepID=A0A839HAG6_9GAMM|nr:ABC transporter substrate-binding protein [Thiospirillum jenense]MBB1075883.1 ABC transporter substrate-binding protein [Rhodoferax jenense]MBB1126093.1 ABC transporter substrate-binding protein [Thiospirillum jenense]